MFDVTNLLGVLQPLVGRVADLIPDPAAKAAALAAANTELLGALMSADKDQTAVNAAEAANPNVFVSGWRPAVGWVCASGFAVAFVIGPFVTWGAALAGSKIVLPPLDTQTLTTLLMGLLGMGGLRTWEKLKGVAASSGAGT